MQSIFSRAVIVVTILFLLLGIILDAEARRRSKRIEFNGAWTNAQLPPGLPDCPGQGTGGVSWNGVTFSGSGTSTYSVSRYCQNTYPYDAVDNSDPADYFNEASFLTDFPTPNDNEPGMAAKVGSNTDNAVTGRRYTFLDGSDIFNANGFQWAFYFFPGNQTLVTLYSELNPGTFGFTPSISSSEGQLWTWSDDGWDGEYWCFSGSELVGIWDGEPAGSSPLAGCEPVDTSCEFLALGHTGEGADPVASPPNSEGCLPGYYDAGELVTLTALPDPNWRVSDWYIDPSGERRSSALDSPAGFAASGNDVREIVISDTEDNINYAVVDYLEIDWCNAIDDGTRFFTWFEDDMESGAPGWTHSASVGADTWGLTSFDFFSPSNAWMASAGGSVSDQVLESPAIAIPADAQQPRLIFYHQRNIGEQVGSDLYCGDGGVLEYSTNSGATWTAVSGSDILEHPYNGQIDFNTNPLGLIPAWCGTSPWVRSEVDLASLSLAGETVQFRFRLGSDDSGDSVGWIIDDVRVAGCAPDPDNHLLRVFDSEGSIGVPIGSSSGHDGETAYARFLAPGTAVELEAPAQADGFTPWLTGPYLFDGWTGCDFADGQTCQVSMTEDKDVYANYYLECHTLLLDSTGSGAVPVANPPNSDGCPPGQYNGGEYIELTAVAGSGWQVSGWSGLGYDVGFNATVYWTMSPQPATVVVHYTEAGLCPPDRVLNTWFQDDMESGAGGWTHSASVGTDEWALESGIASSPTHAWHGPDSDTGNDPPSNAQASDQSLVSPAVAIPAGATNPRLAFQNQRNFEADLPDRCWDGAALELSTDGGSGWTDVESGSFVTDPYNGTLYDSSNPLAANRDVWCGVEPWRRTEVDLTGQEGQSLNFRFRFGTDDTNRFDGWYIDDVEVYGCELPQSGEHALHVLSSAPEPVVISSSSGHGGTSDYIYSVATATTVNLVAPATSGNREFSSWAGCDFDSGTTCTVYMYSNRQVSANYVEPCYELTLSHLGSGADPVATPDRSIGCAVGEYHAGETIGLAASADAGWEVAGWTGTGNDGSGSQANSLEMPAADRAVSVQYIETVNCLAGESEHELFFDDMESGEGGWTHLADVGSDNWALSSARSLSPNTAWHTPGATSQSDSSLVSPAVPVPSTAVAAVLSFYNWREIEESSSFCYDGAVIEYSVDAGGSWLPIASDSFIQDAYNRAITSSTNPIYDGENRDAWCGANPWTRTIAYVDGVAGQSVQFRFRLGTDTSVDREGWYIDDVRILGCTSEMIFADGYEGGVEDPP